MLLDGARTILAVFQNGTEVIRGEDTTMGANGQGGSIAAAQISAVAGDTLDLRYFMNPAVSQQIGSTNHGLTNMSVVFLCPT